MPPFSFKNLVSQGIVYETVFTYKQDSSKRIVKAVRRDKASGLKQEVLLKIFFTGEINCFEEFESLSQVTSPYCVRLLGFESFYGKRALVIEHIRGVSLSQLLEGFYFNPEEIGYILKCIYKGLKDLNQKGLCHGDLSLDNVLIDDKANIKLIDFGKANYGKHLQGTPPFIAPEILHGTQPHFLSDLFSLGVIEEILKSPRILFSDMKLEDFNKNNPLLSSDPTKRVFHYDSYKAVDSKDLSTISYKVKELLSVAESRRRSTIKKKKPVKPSFFVLKFFVMMVILSFFGTAPFQVLSTPKGFIKIYTHQWFFVSIGDIQSYTPLNIPLKEGWHSLKWKNANGEGKKKVFISAGKILFLNDNHFLNPSSAP